MKTSTQLSQPEFSSTLQPTEGMPTGMPSVSHQRRAMTAREKHVLRLICDGLTNKAMAEHLGVTTETVKSELKRIFRKIEVRNRTQAAVLLVKQELS